MSLRSVPSNACMVPPGPGGSTNSTPRPSGSALAPYRVVPSGFSTGRATPPRASGASSRASSGAPVEMKILPSLCQAMVPQLIILWFVSRKALARSVSSSCLQTTDLPPSSLT